MLDYASAFINRSGSFPNILAVNASGPSATDGTEFVANMINDSMWGIWQMILDRAGLSPNGVVESASNSQIREAIQKGFGGAPGLVQEWHLADDPGTSGHRCLLLTGQGVLRANYPELDAACYVGDANNAAVAAAGGAYFRANNSDGSSPSITGAYLILPDRRGVVPRGLDPAASIDPDGASRYLGDLQADALGSHRHKLKSVNSSAPTTNNDQCSAWGHVGGSKAVGVGGPGINVNTAFMSFYDVDQFGNQLVEDTGSVETRMYNSSTRWVVWY